MILDNINQLKKYNVPCAGAIERFIATHDCLSLTDEEIEIDGRNLFVRVMAYTPKPAAENKFETHRVYADVQYVIQGIELMQVAPLDVLEKLTDYDTKGDYQFFTAKQNLSDLTVRVGECAVFFPGEAHRPACQHLAYQGMVKKLVFKIKCI